MKKKICALLLLGFCLLSVSACGNMVVSDDTSDVQDSSPIEDVQDSSATEETLESTDTEESHSATTSEEAENGEAVANEELVDGMRPEFKEAMDSYEAFYDEYCDIVKKYSENPSDIKLLADYTDMLTKSAEMAEKFDAWEDSDMNSAELKYYLDVNNRITQKLLDVAE